MENNIAPPTKFTQEIKDNWIKALESGEHVQGFYSLQEYETIDSIDVFVECCIGVLGNVTPGLSNIFDEDGYRCPYEFLENTLGGGMQEKIYTTNDRAEYIKTSKRDYSNVIPLIKSLPVQE